MTLLEKSPYRNSPSLQWRSLSNMSSLESHFFTIFTLKRNYSKLEFFETVQVLLSLHAHLTLPCLKNGKQHSPAYFSRFVYFRSCLYPLVSPSPPRRCLLSTSDFSHFMNNLTKLRYSCSWMTWQHESRHFAES